MRILMVLALLAFGQTLQAQPYGSDWQAAMSAPSARLRLFALMARHPEGAAEAVADLQHDQGFGGGMHVLSGGASIGPVATYDSNINGGTPGETINIKGLIFSISNDSRAKEGMIFGLAPGGNLRFSLASGTVIEGRVSAMAARSPVHGLNVSSAEGSLCLGQFLGGANWLDLCTGRSESSRALSNGRETYSSLALTQQFATQRALFETQVKLRQTRLADYDKLTLEMGLMRASAKVGVLDMRIELGQYVEGQHSRLFGATAALTRPVLGRETTLFASFSREGGATFFGDPRHDQVYAVGLSRPILGRLGLVLSLRERQSTLANYNGTTLGLDFTFRDFTF